MSVDDSAIVGGLTAATQSNPRNVSRLLDSENPSGRGDHDDLDVERAPRSAEPGYDVTN
ncbi:hypothetical protein [Rhodococcus sp. IEGM 1379]|uniref:hypothetical protein n=1 Tax=Rhodococcus sp. IEGM 1379 TaxID=3047086 RepID=UPI0024B682BF|nr:hypothetical protein [Rhodococcus sp. IEGM 1379]MDI9916855.1 hypothetical protein [Rhodococcus sp. IEGM 1379]